MFRRSVPGTARWRRTNLGVRVGVGGGRERGSAWGGTNVKLATRCITVHGVYQDSTSTATTSPIKSPMIDGDCRRPEEREGQACSFAKKLSARVMVPGVTA